MPARSAGWAALRRHLPRPAGARAGLGAGLRRPALRRAGAPWTFADIVPDNLAVIRRIAGLKGLERRVRFHLIGDDLSFAGLPADYDAIWVFGSIHHVPFEIARREALDAAWPSQAGRTLDGAGLSARALAARGRAAVRAVGQADRWRAHAVGGMARHREGAAAAVSRAAAHRARFRVLRAELPLARSSSMRRSGRSALADFDFEALSASCDLLEQPIVREAGRACALAGQGSSPVPPGLFARAASIDLARPVAATGHGARASPSTSKSAYREARSASDWSTTTRPICRRPRP